MYLAVADSVAGGEYYSDCNVAPSTALAHDADLGRRLWEMSETMCDVDGSTEE